MTRAVRGGTRRGRSFRRRRSRRAPECPRGAPLDHALAPAVDRMCQAPSAGGTARCRCGRRRRSRPATGRSVLSAPVRARREVAPVDDRTTYEVPSDGRYTTVSALRSPSKSAMRGSNTIGCVELMRSRPRSAGAVGPQRCSKSTAKTGTAAPLTCSARIAEGSGRRTAGTAVAEDVEAGGVQIVGRPEGIHARRQPGPRGGAENQGPARLLGIAETPHLHLNRRPEVLRRDEPLAVDGRVDFAAALADVVAGGAVRIEHRHGRDWARMRERGAAGLGHVQVDGDRSAAVGGPSPPAEDETGVRHRGSAPATSRSGTGWHNSLGRRRTSPRTRTTVRTRRSGHCWVASAATCNSECPPRRESCQARSSCI